MKKSHKFNELSDRICIEKGCPKKLKQRLIERKPTVSRCYGHHVEHEIARNHIIKRG